MAPTPSLELGPRDLTPAQRRALLDVASAAIEYGLSHGEPPALDVRSYEEAIRVQRASFVTLHRNKELRGCIGTLDASRPLVADVAYNAYAAAFRDPRFPRLSRDELPGLDIHISVLSAPEPLEVSSEADLIARLQPGLHGLVIQEGRRRATFLPSVWENLPETKDFLAQLKLKAGLPVDYWSPTLKTYHYTVESVP
jgi:AmmeMemoRadiSam system protein A